MCPFQGPFVHYYPLRYTDPTGHCADGLSTFVCVAAGAVLVLDLVDVGSSLYITNNPNQFSAEDVAYAETSLGLWQAGIMADGPWLYGDAVATVQGAWRGGKSLWRWGARALAGEATDAISGLSRFRKIGAEAIPDIINAVGDDPTKNYGYFTDSAFGNRRITTIGRGDPIGDTIVAGEMGDRVFDVRPPGDWGLERNYEWMQEAMNNGDVFYLASPITKNNLSDDRLKIKAFGRELDMLLQAGYIRQGNYLVPPELAK